MSSQIRLVALAVLLFLTAKSFAWQSTKSLSISGPQIKVLKRFDVKLIQPNKWKSRFALAFDGKKSEIEVDHIPFDTYKAFTIEAWVRNWKGHIVGQGEYGDPENSVWLSIGKGDKPIDASGWEHGEGTNVQTPIGKHIDPRAWNHIAMVYNGKQQQIFVNGALVHSLDAPKPGPLDKTRKLRIGTHEDSDEFGSGLLRAVRVSKGVRYAMHFVPINEMKADSSTVLFFDCSEGKGDQLKDISGNKRDGKIAAARWVQDDDRFTLNLQDYGINDSNLVNLKSAKELKFLSLRNTAITDASVEILKSMQSLKTLDLYKTNLSRAGFERLRRSLPDCNIIPPKEHPPSLLDISPSGGLFAMPQLVRIKNLTSNSSIRYTLDGSQPKPDSPEYTKPLKIEESRTLNVTLFNKTDGELQRLRREFVIDKQAKLLDLGHKAWKVWDVKEGVVDSPSDWSVVSNVSVAKNLVVQKSNIYNGVKTARPTEDRQGTLRIYQKRKDFADGDLHFEIGSTGNDAIGVAFRLQDEQNYYLFGMDRQRGRRYLAVKKGDEYRTLAQTKRRYDVGRWHQVRIVQKGPKMTVFVDGEKNLEAEDATFAKGTVALYSWGSVGVHFRNLSFRPHSDQE